MAQLHESDSIRRDRGQPSCGMRLAGSAVACSVAVVQVSSVPQGTIEVAALFGFVIAAARQQAVIRGQLFQWRPRPYPQQRSRRLIETTSSTELT